MCLSTAPTPQEQPEKCPGTRGATETKLIAYSFAPVLFCPRYNLFQHLFPTQKMVVEIAAIRIFLQPKIYQNRPIFATGPSPRIPLTEFYWSL